jgi:hypothetical protein
MYKSTVKTVLKRRNTESHYKPEEMTNFLSHKGNANQRTLRFGLTPLTVRWSGAEG